MTAGPAESAEPYVPPSRSLRVLATAADDCRGCSLYADATQVVFGEGPTSAAITLIGEQPGDHEDRQGHPFVGPAGRILWSCVEDAGLDRRELYVTNAVKHFKHETRGKRRLHKKPTAGEVEACHPWIDAELAAVNSPVVVALGATAARSVLRKTIGIASSRNEVFQLGARSVIVTYHPSAVLRADDRALEIRRALVDDLSRAHALASEMART
jgi:uracil-DNA glycosylase